MKKTIISILIALCLVITLGISASALDDGKYSVDYTIKTETGIQKLFVPAKLVVKGGENFVELVFNDTEVDKLYLDGKEYLPVDQMKSPYKNYIGTYNVFDIPLYAFNEDIKFILHTRGNNLVTDEYTINVAEYDKSFDAAAQSESVYEDNFGAQESRFYDWHTGMSFSLWGPFVFLGIVAIAIYVVGKKINK